MSATPYTLYRPARRGTSVVFASPHSGQDYGADFLRRAILNETVIRSSEDAFVDRLFSAATDHGAPLLAATSPRAFIDFNRSPDELDPALIRGVSRNTHNPRIASGLGVVPRVVAGGRAIYRGKLSFAEAEERLRDHWFPYHRALRTLLDESLDTFGEAILIDCHSMPHEAIESLCRARPLKPEIVLGDRYGASADEAIVEQLEDIFLKAGFRVARNAPFAGAYTAQHYGRPSRGQHVVQVEIDRALYMNEAEVKPSAGFPAIKRVMSEVVAQIAEIGRARDVPLAAE